MWMSRSTSRRQRGDVLIEALIGMLLTCIVGLGVVYSTSRVAVSQKDMNLQAMAVSQLRDLLQSNGSGTLDLCSGSHQIRLTRQLSLPVSVDGCATQSARVGKNGDLKELNAVPVPLTLSVSDPALGGEVRVGGGL
ncbi:hypothetical protein SAMN05216193_10716 [Pseudomonas jinjuensis]|uniref:Type IV pilus assembly protein PilV n=2 Tax=Pseudomonas jinjuensis TaxID=198616 RepID=A0A1H0G1N3_9PSED|nr:hypothetical protein SAMN05216193_10716 [Pseudomonas jinjuensis]